MKSALYSYFNTFLKKFFITFEMTFFAFGFQITISASDPTAIRPFLGYILKIFAQVELKYFEFFLYQMTFLNYLVTATNLIGSMTPR